MNQTRIKTIDYARAGAQIEKELSPRFKVFVCLFCWYTCESKGKFTLLWPLHCRHQMLKRWSQHCFGQIDECLGKKEWQSFHHIQILSAYTFFYLDLCYRGIQGWFASARKRRVFVISNRNDGRSCHTLLSRFPSYPQSIQPINPVHDTFDQQHLLRMYDFWCRVSYSWCSCRPSCYDVSLIHMIQFVTDENPVIVQAHMDCRN